MIWRFRSYARPRPGGGTASKRSALLSPVVAPSVGTDSVTGIAPLSGQEVGPPGKSAASPKPNPAAPIATFDAAIESEVVASKETDDPLGDFLATFAADSKNPSGRRGYAFVL